MRRFLLAVLIAGLIVFSVIVTRSSVEFPEASPGRFSGTVKTVFFKSASGQELAFYLFSPNKPAQGLAPAHVYVHGGGWVARDRHCALLPHSLGVFELMADQGWIGVSVDYRLVSETTTIDDAIADVKDLLRYLSGVGRDYGIDPERIALWGGSSGGHLALMAALSPPEAFPGEPSLRRFPAKVTSVVSWYGPMDLTALSRAGEDRAGKLKKVLGCSPEEDPAEYARLSPISSLKGESVPVLLISGDSDTQTPPEQSVDFYQAARRQGLPCWLVLVGEADHMFTGVSEHVLHDIHAMTAEFLMGQRQGVSSVPTSRGTQFQFFAPDD